jgi:hypothetical protein
LQEALPPKLKVFYRSTLALICYDCQNRKSVLVHFVDYAGQAGIGKIVDILKRPFDPDGLQDIVPGSIGEAMLELVCRAGVQVTPFS